MLALSSSTVKVMSLPAVRTGTSLTGLMLVLRLTVAALYAVEPPLADTLVVAPLARLDALLSTNLALKAPGVPL